MTRIERDCVRCLQASAAGCSLALTATVIKQRPWSSALFSGARLTVVVTGDNDGRLDDWLIALPEVELPLTGHFVADVEVIERSANTATIELLVLES